MPTISISNYDNALKVIEELKRHCIEANIQPGGLCICDFYGEEYGLVAKSIVEAIAEKYKGSFSFSSYTHKQHYMDAFREMKEKEPLIDVNEDLRQHRESKEKCERT